MNKINSKNLSKDQIRALIRSSVGNKPDNIIISDIKWKLLFRSVYNGKNIMMTGPAGSGKTMTVQTLADITNRPYFYFNLGATQDPRGTLIGNTHYDKERGGTFFAKSLFVQAIQTPNAIILMDELTRCHPEGWNILMTVFDENQRYLRIDEHVDTPTIKVADGVCFMATANIGIEYTSTRVLDAAIRDRFQVIEMELLNESECGRLLNLRVPDNSQYNDLLAKIYSELVIESSGETPSISNHISIRLMIETAEIMADGFSLLEAAQVTILPNYDAEGGAESDRMKVFQKLEKYNISDLSDPELFKVTD